MDAHRRLLAVAAVAGVVATLAACASDDDEGGELDEPATILDLTEFVDIDPGDVLSLRDDGAGGVEWIERRSGRVVTLPDIARFFDEPASADDVETIATIDVIGADGEPPVGQRGLVGHTVIGDTRYAAWTDPDTDELLVGTVDDEPRIVWAGGGTDDGAVGGQLRPYVADGTERLLLGIGQLTDWAQVNDSGAMVTLDPAGPSDQEPRIVSDGYINPFAFDVTDDGSALWVADNAVGDDSERIGRGDLLDRNGHSEVGGENRAPAAMLELDEATLLICGFLDGELQRWNVAGMSPARVDTVGPCLTAVASVELGDHTDGTSVLVNATADALVALPLP
ncbi:MAG: hypothetical protein AAGF73_06915 [Actinomycetota bacterium]